MSERGFEGLSVYRRSAALADAVRDAVMGWGCLDRPRGAADEADTVGRMPNGLIASLKNGRIRSL